MEKRNPTTHSMHRRSDNHNYSRAGIYHVTLKVPPTAGHPLGTVGGSADAPDGSPQAPHVQLSAIGQMVQDELLHGIPSHYGMISIDAYVIMPEHVHVLLVVHDNIISASGRPTHLGQVIAGFKKGCNRRYWEWLGLPPAGEPLGTRPSGATAAGDASLTNSRVPGGSPAGCRPPSNGSSGRPSLFDAGYCDVMPVDAAQLQRQRAYIAANPRTRLLRSQNPQWLQTQRGAVTTALKASALRAYLLRQCAPEHTPTPALDALQARLLLTADGLVMADTFGCRSLLSQRLLPVVCHRRDKAHFAEQQTRCHEAAVSASLGAVSQRETASLTMRDWPQSAVCRHHRGKHSSGKKQEKSARN